MSVSEPPDAPNSSDKDSEASSPPETTGSSGDVVLVHGVTEDGEGFKVLRRRGGHLESGAARPLKHGQPIAGEVVRLIPRQEFPLLCDVEVALPAPPAPAADRKGPPKVATERYRENWDAIWNPPASRRQALN